MEIKLKSTITCPNCGHMKEEIMPTNACQYFYECEKCKQVLLCGVTEGMEINPDYLNIAYKTKGSVHTIEQDITTLMQQTTGKKFTINGVDYIIKNGNIRAY